MSLSLIVAMDSQSLIGVDNRLPWRLPEDLARFKELTMGHPILMGRKTWQSLGRPLPGRENMVLSRQMSSPPEGATLFKDWDAAAAAASAGKGFVIGGKALFEMALPLVERAYVTRVYGDFEGDAWFPVVDWNSGFTLEKSSGRLASKTGLEYEYIDYCRR